METTFLTTLICFLLFIAALFVCGWIICEVGKRNAERAKEYETKYKRTEDIIDNYEVCDANYDWLMSLLEHLGQLDYKDKERTEVLTMRFFRKYETIAKERASEFEHSPENAFGIPILE